MASRDPELYKDKIEVNLDGRQIFYLFFGGSVIVGLVFVLGVMVGRRVEARGHMDHAHTSVNVDPLAALDRLEGSGGLSFQGALSGGATGSGAEVDRAIAELAAKKVDAAKPAPVVAAAPVPVAKKDEPAKKKDDEPAKKKDDEPAKVRYTLQLSSFQDKGEAQAFLDNMKSAGYQATLTEAEVEGKGTFYRIRYGTYRSLDAATEAKSEVEKAAHKSASIMKL